ncbi:MAG: MEDS domain-containing protein, partial [Candidatus Methanoperedens sp.]
MIDQENTRNELVNALERIDVHDHLCLIYESLEEQLAAVIPFFKKGLKSNEQCVYIVDDNTVQTVLDAMRSEGIDVDSVIRSGALKVITKRDSYLKEGYFDSDSMIQFLKEAVDSAKKKGFAGLRVTGEMTWALGNDPGDERLIEYEAKLNYFVHEYKVQVICQYNRNRFPPEIIINVIRTHPLVIYGSLVCENFYYVPPDEFLGPKNMQISMEVERLLKNIQDYESANKKLREVSSYTRSLIEASLDPFVTISPDGKITDVNKGTELVTGISREKLIGKDFSDYFTEREKARKGYQEVFEKGFVRDYPLAIRHISGGITDVLYNASVYRDASGNIAGVFAAARDITQRKRAEEARSMLASIVEFSEDGIIGKTIEGIIVSWNPGAEKLYGYSENEVIGKPISILIP